MKLFDANQVLTLNERGLKIRFINELWKLISSWCRFNFNQCYFNYFFMSLKMTPNMRDWNVNVATQKCVGFPHRTYLLTIFYLLVLSCTFILKYSNLTPKIIYTKKSQLWCLLEETAIAALVHPDRSSNTVVLNIDLE